MATRPSKPIKLKARPPAKPVFKGAPNVIVDFVFEDGALFIAVTNLGDAPALKVKTSFSERLSGVIGGVAINDLALFQNIEFLAPHKTIHAFLDSSAAYFARNEPRRITVRVAFSDSNARRYQHTIQHDLGIYADIGYVERNPT
ncbi:MAG: hypothetical protein FJY56_02940 [Betaproteobacteria bacterium]|nr:hypothetical protein [Betaproteobacteria bacterium]